MQDENDHRRRRHIDLLDAAVATELLRVTAAILLTLISGTVWLLVSGMTTTRPFLTFALAVMPFSIACGIALGRQVGLIATVATSVLGLYLILPPRFSFDVLDDMETAFFAAVLLGTAFASFVLGSQGTRR